MASVIGASTGWWIGLVLGIVVIAVAAVIVIAIVMLARRIAGQARGAVEGVEVVRAQTDELAGIARINDSGVQDPAFRARPSKGGGGQMTTLAVSDNGLWAVSLGIGLVAALVVAFLLIVLVRTVDDIDRSVGGLLEVAGKVAGNTAQHPTARGDRARARADRGRGRGPGPLYERPDRRVRRIMSDTDSARAPQRPARGGRRWPCSPRR